MHEEMWLGNGLKPFKFMEIGVSKHKRSQSDPVKRKAEENISYDVLDSSCHNLGMGQLKAFTEAKKSRPANSEIRTSLKQEILHLQEQLRNQIIVRHALEKALTYQPFSHDAPANKSIPKPTEELIQEIATLEMEVGFLEQYLLSLYRKTFDERILYPPTVDAKLQTTSIAHKDAHPEVPGNNIKREKENLSFRSYQVVPSRKSIGSPSKECKDISGPQMLLDSSICRTHSSLSQSTRSFRVVDSLAKAVDSYHSVPLLMLEQAEATSSNKTHLAEHQETCDSDHMSETPNWISEEMVKCISSIYCELADPPLVDDCYPSSPTAISISINELPTHDQGDTSSRELSFESHIDKPFHIISSEESHRPYGTMVKVHWISRDSKKLRNIDYMLRRFRRLVCRLEEVHPRKMKHEEKLAFWMNVHNALVMHAYLVYGIPQNNLKRMSMILKAAYNIGGQGISVDTIQSSILGCRPPRPGQWLRFLFTSKTKFKAGDRRKAYAIQHPEPLLHFALCSGSHSDPAVRVFTPHMVFQELEAAKLEYILSTISVKGKKIMLPKIVESFAKDSDLCSVGLMGMVEQYMLRSTCHKHRHRKFGKNIQWMPHNFAFGYTFSKELA